MIYLIYSKLWTSKKLRVRFALPFNPGCINCRVTYVSSLLIERSFTISLDAKQHDDALMCGGGGGYWNTHAKAVPLFWEHCYDFLTHLPNTHITKCDAFKTILKRVYCRLNGYSFTLIAIDSKVAIKIGYSSKFWFVESALWALGKCFSDVS